MRKRKTKINLDDPQVDSVYAWEAAFDNFNVCTLDLDQCWYAADKALRFYDCDPLADLIQGPYNAYSWSAPESRVICMQGPSRKGRGGMNVATVLHEAAHQIVWDLFDANARDHGPTFVAIYRDLLLSADVLTEDEFSLTAAKFGLKWRTDL